jgi:hypothetical protein
MKTTAQRLSEVYCRPNNSEWVDLIGYVPNRDTATYAVYDGELGVIDANESEVTYLTEVQSSHFIDLLQDKIVSWRLEEDGFSHNTPMIEVASYPMGNITVCFHEGNVSVILDPNDSPWHSHICKGCKTYTDLLTLIKLIG